MGAPADSASYIRIANAIALAAALSRTFPSAIQTEARTVATQWFIHGKLPSRSSQFFRSHGIAQLVKWPPVSRWQRKRGCNSAEELSGAGLADHEAKCCIHGSESGTNNRRTKNIIAYNGEVAVSPNYVRQRLPCFLVRRAVKRSKG